MKRFGNFSVAILVLTVMPLLPLILEFVVLYTSSKTSSDAWLEPKSILVTAPIFVMTVGIASQIRAIVIVAIVLAACLSGVYGARLIEDRPSRSATQTVATTEGSKSASSPRTTFDKVSMIGDREAEFAWITMGIMAFTSLVERMIRHLFYDEEYIL